MTDTMNPAEIADWESSQNLYVGVYQDPAGFRAYAERRESITRDFAANLRKEYLNTKVPDATAQNLFDVAYSDGHAEGYSGILDRYVQMAELLNGLIEDLGL